jgi:hypothetical protein
MSKLKYHVRLGRQLAGKREPYLPRSSPNSSFYILCAQPVSVGSKLTTAARRVPVGVRLTGRLPHDAPAH